MINPPKNKLRAYNDSLSLYNKGLKDKALAYKNAKEMSKNSFGKGIIREIVEKGDAVNSYKSDKIRPLSVNTFQIDNNATDYDGFPVYKKPTKPIEESKVNFGQPEVTNYNYPGKSFGDNRTESFPILLPETNDGISQGNTETNSDFIKRTHMNQFNKKALGGDILKSKKETGPIRRTFNKFLSNTPLGKEIQKQWPTDSDKLSAATEVASYIPAIRVPSMIANTAIDMADLNDQNQLDLASNGLGILGSLGKKRGKIFKTFGKVIGIGTDIANVPVNLQPMEKKKFGGKFLNNEDMNGISPSTILSTSASAIDALDAGNEYGRQTTGTQTAKGALEGASLGMAFGPVGAIGGAVIGGAFGLINGSKERQEEQRLNEAKINSQRQLAASSARAMRLQNPYIFDGQRANMYKFGGYIKKKALGGELEEEGNLPPRRSKYHMTYAEIKAEREGRSTPTEVAPSVSSTPIVSPALSGEAARDQARSARGAGFTRGWIKQREARGDFGLKPSDKFEKQIQTPTVYQTRDAYDDNAGNLSSAINNKISGIKSSEYSYGMYAPAIVGNGKSSINGALTRNADIPTTATHESTHQFQDNLGSTNILVPAHRAWSSSKDAINRELERTGRGSQGDGISSSYYDKPEEVHARIMEGRADLGLQPGQPVTQDHINKMKGSTYYQGLKKVLDDEGIINVFNKTVGTQDADYDTTMATGRFGGYVKKATGGPIKSKYDFSNGSSYNNSNFEDGVATSNRKVKRDATATVRPQAGPLKSQIYQPSVNTNRSPQFNSPVYEGEYSGNAAENMGANSMSPEYQMGHYQLRDNTVRPTATLPYGANLPSPLTNRMANYLNHTDKKYQQFEQVPLPNGPRKDIPNANRDLLLDGEGMTLGGRNKTVMAMGGSLQKLNSRDELVVGNSHAQGGVKFPEKGVELEGGETKSGNFVFSKELGFADKSLPLMQLKSHLEGDKKKKGLLSIINKGINNLKIEQESTKANLGIENDLGRFALGGPIKPKPKKIDPKSNLGQYYLDADKRHREKTGGKQQDGSFKPINPAFAPTGTVNLNEVLPDSLRPIIQNSTLPIPPKTNKPSQIFPVKPDTDITDFEPPKKPKLNESPGKFQVPGSGKFNTPDNKQEYLDEIAAENRQNGKVEEPKKDKPEKQDYELGNATFEIVKTKRNRMPDLKPIAGKPFQSTLKPSGRTVNKDELDGYLQNIKQEAGLETGKKDLSRYLPFVSNAVNMLRNYPKIPQPILATAEQQPLINLNPERANLDQQISRTGAKLEGLSSQQKQSAVGSLLANSIEGKNNLTSIENRANNDIKRSNVQTQNQVNLFNNQLQNKFLSDNAERSLNIIQNNQENLNDAIDKHLSMRQDEIQDALDNKRIERLSSLFDKSVKDKANVTLDLGSRKKMFGGYTRKKLK